MEHREEKNVMARQTLMRACALATDAELQAAVELVADGIEVVDLRPPEVGLVMMRGRVGGDGAPFNVGEASVTRAVVRLPSGEVGHSYLLGRSSDRARQAALLDAVGQQGVGGETLLEMFVKPVMARAAAERQSRGEETRATRVNFFTLVRGED